MRDIINLIDRFKGKKVLVVGDFILDEYIYGETERISREAPVLILKYSNTVYLAGGGANPVMNIAALGGIAVPVSIVGNDSYSNIILKILQDKKIDTSFIIRDNNYVLPVKTRIMAGSIHTVKQQIVRIDKYHEMEISKEKEKELINIIDDLKDKVDAILISDYDGGLISGKIINYINKIARAGKKVVVDSRYSLKYFRYITTATPNETEAGPVVGIEKYEEKDIEKIIKKLKNVLKAKGMIITRGSKGMVVLENNKIFKIPAFGTEEIVDVSGAGDTVASIVALGLSCNFSIRDAAYLANIGAGLVVMKRGVATVKPEELKRACRYAKN